MAWNGFSSALKVLHYSKKEIPKGAKKVPISFLFCFKELDVREKMPTKRLKKNKRNKLIKGFQVWLQMAPNASKWFQMTPNG